MEITIWNVEMKNYYQFNRMSSNMSRNYYLLNKQLKSSVILRFKPNPTDFLVFIQQVIVFSTQEFYTYIHCAVKLNLI